jgi:PAS domain S-box-containing protein
MTDAGANEEILRLVHDAVQAIDAGVAIVDRERTFVWVNRWLEDRYPMLMPLVGSKCHRLICGSDEPCDMCPLSGAGDGVTRTVQDTRCSTASTEPTWIEIQGASVKDADGHVIGAVAHFQDVTARKTAQNAVVEEMARRRALTEQSRDGIVIVDSECAVVEANPAFARMLGYTQEEVASLHVWDWDAVFSPEELIRQMEEANSLGAQFQTVHRRKDGSTYEVEISQNAEVFGDRKYNLCICRDISEQKRLDREQEAARLALVEEVARRRALFEQSRDGIVVVTRDGAVHEANANYAGQLGYTLDEVSRLRIWDWNKTLRPEELLEMLRSDDPRGRVISTRHTRKDGSSFDVEIISNAVTIAGEVYILCACRDVSEQRLAERERQSAQRAFEEEASRRRLLVEQSRDGIVVLDENGKVWESNEAFATMIGYSAEEMLSLHVWDWEYQSPRDRVREMIESVDSSGDHFVTVHRRKDGSTYEVEISTNGAFYGGKKYVFCVCRDITEKVRAEREREALIAKLQEALAELKTLRGIIPVCSFCKKVRDDQGYWEQVEVYIRKHSEADVSHGICPDCLRQRLAGMDARSDTT